MKLIKMAVFCNEDSILKKLKWNKHFENTIIFGYTKEQNHKKINEWIFC